MQFAVTEEKQILDPEVRAKIIQEIRGSENGTRKDEAYKRYLSFKDKTRRLVMDQLEQLFDQDTVLQMSYAIANVSVVKKVINKLAQVYANGVVRKVLIEGKEDEQATKNLQQLEEVLDFNSEMKKENRFLKLQKNLLTYVRPQRLINDQWCMKVEGMQPFNYDVIPDPSEKTKPWIVILSKYRPLERNYVNGNAATAGRSTELTPSPNPPLSDKTDQAIADPDDGNNDEFIWWSPSYHFTTNCKGEYVGGPVNPQAPSVETQRANPIKKLPFVNFAIDQDGEFWAIGGDDLIDGGVLVNSMISQTNHIAVVQGYGQFWMKGKNLPRNIKTGPTKVILMEHADKDDPAPEIGFASANPNLESLARLVEMYVALLLTTNNLSTSAVSSQLASGQTLASGIALMLDKAESREDVQDQQQIYKDNETDIWNLLRDWMKVYANKLDDELKNLQLPEKPFKVGLNFNPSQVIQSESEKLDNLKKRKDLGLNTKEELIMIDNPGMTEAEAKEKLKKIEQQMKEAVATMIKTSNLPPGNPDPNAPKPPAQDPKQDPPSPEDQGDQT